MKIMFSITVCSLVILSLGNLFAKEASKENAVYEKILKQIQSGDVKADYKTLRLSCTDSKYSCEVSREIKKEIRTFLTEKDFSKALKEINGLLKKVFVDIDLHYFAFIANVETNNEKKAEFHLAVLRGLLDSIQEDKHGRSEEDAFTVINVQEEYVFLGFSGMNVQGQSLLRKDGHSYDVMTCSSEEGGEPFDVYFNIDIPMNRLSRLLDVAK